MVACGQAVFDIPAKRDAYRPVFRVIVPIVEYFGNKMNTIGRTYLAARKEEKGRKFRLKLQMHSVKLKLPVERNTMQPIRWSKCNSPSLSGTHRCEMCTIHSNCRTAHLPCRKVRAAPATPSLPIEFDLDSPVKW